MPELNDIMRQNLKQMTEDWMNEASQQTANLLLLGESGAGKTWTIGTTAPRPVYIYSFDPAGCKGLRPLVEKGEVIVDSRFELNKENLKNRMIYSDFVKDYNAKLDSGFWEHIGTISFDSLTTLSNAMMMRICGGAKPDYDHWRAFKASLENLGHELASLPCHNILTAHVEAVKNEVTGQVDKTLFLSGQAQKTLPIIMGEVWAIVAQDTPKGTERVIFTQSHKSYITRTRNQVGSELPVEMKPDIRAAIAAMGLDASDKPLLTQGAQS